MISAKHIINNVEYIVRAKNKTELNKAVEFLYACNEYQMAQLEEGLNKDFDQLLQDIDEGKVVLPSRVDAPEEEVAPVEQMPHLASLAGPIETNKKIETKPTNTTKPAPKTPRAKTPTAQKKDNKTVNLGGMGKSE